MKNLFNVQTKNNVKEAVKDSANIEYLATGKEKVVLVGRDLSSKVSLPRYSSLFFIFSSQSASTDTFFPGILMKNPMAKFTEEKSPHLISKNQL